MDITAIKKRCDAATKGPWSVEETHGIDCIWLDVVGPGDCCNEILNGETQPRPHIVHPDYRHECQVGKEQILADLEFVAHARSDIPDLLEALAKADARIKELTKVTV